MDIGLWVEVEGIDCRGGQDGVIKVSNMVASMSVKGGWTAGLFSEEVEGVVDKSVVGLLLQSFKLVR